MTEDHVARIQAQWRIERPDVDTSPQGVIGRLHRIANSLTGELTLLYGKFGLTEGEFDVLAALRRAGSPYEHAPGELALHTMVTTGAISKRVDRLEEAGLVRRRRSDADGRGRVVRLTPAGRRLFDRAFSAHMANEQRLLEVLTPDERAQLERLLTAWLGRLES
ncbi:MarR family transcriptional regulator [Kribbella solani]|uniref:MarR family winged helix-turn-helix transcriptional regulator n=1 Tax=Kribbella solani TaxID=236067 RepID=UPI0029BB5335|nr:MarR family transcriptional regulator [Kribbella solani]MDX2969443.1 MarR family transcriptional regulator [Kribbella solani]MDX3001864.1 MarR family transcriptional regulator [Kribbella solani]